MPMPISANHPVGLLGVTNTLERYIQRRTNFAGSCCATPFHQLLSLVETKSQGEDGSNQERHIRRLMCPLLHHHQHHLRLHDGHGPRHAHRARRSHVCIEHPGTRLRTLRDRLRTGLSRVPRMPRNAHEPRRGQAQRSMRVETLGSRKLRGRHARRWSL